MVTCKTPRVKPAPKTTTTRTPTVVCASPWRAARLTIDPSIDGQDSNRVRVNKEEYTRKPADQSPEWKKF